ncbi:MAG: hypothetical protein QW761_00160 [Candidatus Aenigmatarchaeota archaeon]
MARRPNPLAASISKWIGIKFPLGGVVRRFAYQSQEPYTTFDALNIVPQGHPKYRWRVQRRPGVDLAIRETLVDQKPVNMLASLGFVQQGEFAWWAEDFMASNSKGQMPSSWQRFDAGFAVDLLQVDSLENMAFAPAIGERYGGYRPGPDSANNLPPIDHTKDWIWEVFFWPQPSTHTKVFLTGWQTTNNPFENSFILEWEYRGSDAFIQGVLKTYAGNVLKNSYTITSGFDNQIQAGWLAVRKAENRLIVYWRGSTLLDQDVSGDGVVPGNGFGIALETIAGHGRIVSARFQYVPLDKYYSTTRRILVACADGNIYRETFYGSMGQLVSGNGLFNKIEQLSAVEYQQKLYIADYGRPVFQDRQARVLQPNLLEISVPGVNLTTLGINNSNHIVNIYDASEDSGVFLGSYGIGEVQSTRIVISENCTSQPGALVSIRIEPGPKVYDPLTDSISLWKADSGLGHVPGGQKILARWRDRLILAGGDTSPHVWYMSAIGRPNDWLFADTDPSGAVAGTASRAGTTNEPITALVPHRDLCLYIATEHSLWIMLGDPAAGGTLELLSDQIGILDKNAWTFTAEFELVFLSHDGIYAIDQPCGVQPPVAISRQKLPSELLKITRNNFYVNLAWDQLHRGVHIYVTPKYKGKTKWWFLEWENKSFWPMEYPEDFLPGSIIEGQTEHTKFDGIRLGCVDGRIRAWNGYLYGDDTLPITARISYGPLNLAGDAAVEGLITAVQVTMSDIPGSHVRLKVLAENSPEAIEKAQARYEAEMEVQQNGGLQARTYPRVRGGAAALQLEHTGPIPWGIDSIQMAVRHAGWLRVRF